METKKQYIDIMSDMINLSFDDIDFGKRFQDEAMQNRLIRTMHSSHYNWVDSVYRSYLVARKDRPNYSAYEFVDTLKKSYTSKGVDMDKELSGLTSTRTIANVFDNFAGVEGTGVVASVLTSKGTKDVADSADMAYYYMDKVSEYISNDENLKASYLSMDKSGRQTMIMSILKKLKKSGTLTKPSQNEVKKAQLRWRAYYRRSSDEAILLNMRDNGVNITKSGSFLNKFAGAIAENLNSDRSRHLYDKKTLNNIGEDSVDINIDNSYGMTLDSPKISKEATKEEKENLIEFGKLYPRSTPAFKVAKELQPFNIKAGLKFLDQIIESFNNVLVKNPWPDNSSSRTM